MLVFWKSLYSVNYDKEKQRTCFLSCVPQVVVIAAVMQVRQPHQEGEPWKDKMGATHTDKPSPSGCPHSRATFY